MRFLRPAPNFSSCASLPLRLRPVCLRDGHSDWVVSYRNTTWVGKRYRDTAARLIGWPSCNLERFIFTALTRISHTGSSCASSRRRQGRRMARADAPHRPSRSTHTVGVFSWPSGLHFDGRPLRRAAQPYDAIRFSPLSLRSTRRNRNAGRPGVRNAGEAHGFPGWVAASLTNVGACAFGDRSCPATVA